jgi:hypothetical protein
MESEDLVMTHLTRLPLGVIALLALAACATNQVDRQQVTAQKAQQVRGEIPATKSQIDVTLTALRSLMESDPAALKPAYQRYAKDVEEMKDQARQINQDAMAMRKDSQAYLSAWEKDHAKIHDEELRKASEQRRLTLVNRLQSFENTYDRTQSALDSFIRNLDDVRLALASDLTERGVSTVERTDVVQNAQQNANELKARLDAVQATSAALAAALAPQTGGATGTEAAQQQPQEQQ